VEEALAELVAAGLVASDSFAGLRALLTPSEKRKPLGGRKRRHRSPLFGIEEAGRWSLVKRTPAGAAAKRNYYEPDQDMVEHVVHALLRRYGVVFWRLLQREVPEPLFNDAEARLTAIHRILAPAPNGRSGAPGGLTPRPPRPINLELGQVQSQVKPGGQRGDEGHQ
jgi:hypothetical protein